MTRLPSFCPKHPNAKVQIEWDTFPKETEKKYFCNVCGKELCSRKEFQERCERRALLERAIIK